MTNVYAHKNRRQHEKNWLFRIIFSLIHSFEVEKSKQMTSWEETEGQDVEFIHHFSRRDSFLKYFTNQVGRFIENLVDNGITLMPNEKILVTEPNYEMSFDGLIDITNGFTARAQCYCEVLNEVVQIEISTSRRESIVRTKIGGTINTRVLVYSKGKAMTLTTEFFQKKYTRNNSDGYTIGETFHSGKKAA